MYRLPDSTEPDFPSRMIELINRSGSLTAALENADDCEFLAAVKVSGYLLAESDAVRVIGPKFWRRCVQMRHAVQLSREERQEQMQQLLATRAGTRYSTARGADGTESDAQRAGVYFDMSRSFPAGREVFYV